MLARALYKYWAAIVFLAVVLQIGLAGYGAFFTASKVENEGDVLTHTQFDDGWRYHDAIGWAVLLAALILVVLALFVRSRRSWTMLTAGLAGLVIVQALLAGIGLDTAAAGALHALNAVAILGVSGWLAHAAWRKSTAQGA